MYRPWLNGKKYDLIIHLNHYPTQERGRGKEEFKERAKEKRKMIKVVKRVLYLSTLCILCTCK